MLFHINSDLPGNRDVGISGLGGSNPRTASSGVPARC